MIVILFIFQPRDDFDVMVKRNGNQTTSKIVFYTSFYTRFKIKHPENEAMNMDGLWIQFEKMWHAQKVPCFNLMLRAIPIFIDTS